MSELLVDVQITPRASRDQLGGRVGGRVKIQLTAPPVDGEANLALRIFLAKLLGVPRAQVEIIRGETSRKKTVRLVGVSAETWHQLTETGERS